MLLLREAWQITCSPCSMCQEARQVCSHGGAGVSHYAQPAPPLWPLPLRSPSWRLAHMASAACELPPPAPRPDLISPTQEKILAIGLGQGQNSCKRWWSRSMLWLLWVPDSGFSEGWRGRISCCSVLGQNPVSDPPMEVGGGQISPDSHPYFSPITFRAFVFEGPPASMGCWEGGRGRWRKDPLLPVGHP